MLDARRDPDLFIVARTDAEAGTLIDSDFDARDQPFILEDPERVRDLCASVRAAIVDVLVTKTVRAAKRLGVSCVTASGGVTCNRGLRRELVAACAQHHLTLRLAEKSLCTDNAAMVAILAERKWQRGLPATSLDAEVQPNWALANA